MSLLSSSCLSAVMVCVRLGGYGVKPWTAPCFQSVFAIFHNSYDVSRKDGADYQDRGKECEPTWKKSLRICFVMFTQLSAGKLEAVLSQVSHIISHCSRVVLCPLFLIWTNTLNSPYQVMSRLLLCHRPTSVWLAVNRDQNGRWGLHSWQLELWPDITKEHVLFLPCYQTNQTWHKIIWSSSNIST